MISWRTVDIEAADARKEMRNSFRIPEHVRMAHGADGATVLDILRGQIFRLNFAASRILEFLKQGLAEVEIAKRLALEFAIDPVVIECDMRDFLLTLETNRLISRRDDDPLA